MNNRFIFIFRTQVNHLFEGDRAMVEDSEFTHRGAYSSSSVVGLNPINTTQPLKSDRSREEMIA